MQQTLKDNIKLLIKDGEEIGKINISILLSFKRNKFFRHLGNYIDFYTRLKSKLKNMYSKDSIEYEIIERIPDLHFEDYSINFLNEPSFFIAIFEWGYIKEIKLKLKKGLIEYNLLMKEIKE
jgi:hypothetical protein